MHYDTIKTQNYFLKKVRFLSGLKHIGKNTCKLTYAEKQKHTLNIALKRTVPLK